MENAENNTPIIDAGFNDDDFFGDISNEIANEETNQNVSEDSLESDSSVPNENQQEEENEVTQEVDYSPFLKDLSTKVKYNKENVNVESIDDVVSNYQKGLNYDKLQEKFNNLQNGKALTYIQNKADELGMTVDEYMDQVQEYEKEQQTARENERIQQMIESGVPEDLAREVVATAELRKQLQYKENELKKQEEAKREEERKNKEFDDFIKKYPNVKAEEIPEEVFEKSQSSSLTNAYTEYLLEKTQKELEIARQNNINAERNVGSTTDHSGKASNNSKDLFLQGFEE